MTRTIRPLALILVVALMACHTPPGLEPDPEPTASDLTAEQLIAKANAARGGEPNLASIQSVKMTGTWSTNPKNASPVTVIIAPQRYMRRIEQGSGVPSIRAVDGQTNWQINPQSGIVKPAPMSAKEAARFHRLADPQGPLFNYQAKGHKVEVIGKHPWRTSEVYKLKITYRDGGVSFLYLDAQTFLPVRAVGTMYVAESDVDVDLELIYQNYRAVNGVKWPFSEKSFIPQAEFNQTITWDKIEINPQPLDEAVFKAPKS